LRVPETEGLRVGLVTGFGNVPVDPEIVAAARKAAGHLADLGYRVEPFEPRNMERAPNLWWFFFGQLPAPFLRQLFNGREEDAHWTSTEFLNKALAEPAPNADQVMENLAARDAMRAALLRQMEQVPVLIMPPCGITAFSHRARRWQIGERTVGLFQAMMPATPWNLLGFPAIVLPMDMSSEGLPIGVQLVGRPYEEERLLEVAVELEEARGTLPSPI
jgi:Asp-tRNA(Asn)/Glu-tRNA(Gln) amidotransferase A subunit family amidase